MVISRKGALVFPKGFLASAVHCGLKSSAKKQDLAIIFSPVRCSCAGLYTRNRIVAAPVRYSRGVTRRGYARAIVVNAGNANACTGKAGLEDARRTASLVAEPLGISPGEVIVASTGIIGERLPMEKIEKGISLALPLLSSHPEMAHLASLAILTTDTISKEGTVSLKIGRKAVRIGGMAKGAGMIAPHLATMLCFITTDAAISPGMLKASLREAVSDSFECLTVDGHTSTNDTVAALASGKAGNGPITRRDSRFRAFTTSLRLLCQHLARSIARDGEGATKLVEVNVKGAASSGIARAVARGVAESALVKTAIFGGDPNWGRIVSAAGYSTRRLNEKNLSLRINGVLLFRKGLPVGESAKGRARRAMRSSKISIELELGRGTGEARIWTCDFSYDYVRINAEYHT